jgi:maltose-binding protein MalE
MGFKELVKTHKPTAVKIVLVVVALIFLGLSIVDFASNQSTKAQQTANSQAAVANHTQTLDEIKQAVNQLKASNAADHTVTIKYINCVLVGITQANPPDSQSAILAVYQQCLADSQIPGTPVN